MLDNIRLNNLENVIIPVNAGLASKSGKMFIENHKLSEFVSNFNTITLDENHK